MSLVAIQKIIDVPEGTTPTFPYLKSMARHIKAAQAELAALEAGSEPGFAASIDLRWFAEDVGAANAIEIVPTQEPESGNALVSGMFYDVLIAATNDQAAVTMEVRNTADDVSITKSVKDQSGNDLAPGDLVQGRVERLQYVTDGGSLDEWRVMLLRPVTQATMENYVEGYVTGTQPIPIDASAIRPATTDGCDDYTTDELTAGAPEIGYVGFPDTGTTWGLFSVRMPGAWDGGTVTFEYEWTTSDTGTDDARLTLQAVAVHDSDDIDGTSFSGGVAVVDTAQGGAHKQGRSAESGALTILNSPAPGATVWFRIGRVPTHAEDTLAALVKLMRLTIFITTTKPTDD